MRNFRRLLIGVLLAAAWGGAAFAAKAPSAKDLYKRGRSFEKAGNVAQAYLLYSQAAVADPKKAEYWQRAEALRTKAAMAANVMPTGSLDAAPDLAEDAGPFPEATSEEMQEARRPQPPVELEAAADKKDFDLRGDARNLWEQVLKAYGLDLIFEGDYPESGPTIRFHITDAGYRDALHALMTSTGSFIVPVSPRLLLVVKDTEQKRREVENTIALSVPIPQPVTLQEAQEMARSVQQLMELQHFAIDSTQRIVLMRDRASKVAPAEALLRQMMHHRAEVALEVEVVVVPKTSSLRFGIATPTSFPIVPLIKTVLLSGGPLSFGLTLGTTELIASWTKTTGHVLFRATMRGLDGFPTSLHSGERYPIVTMSYIGEPPPGDAEVFVPPPTFNYEDLGLVLKITPRIHDSKEVTLEVEADHKLLTGASINGNPVISSRKFVNRVRLRFDQTAIVAGLVQNSKTSSLSGLAGVTSIPILGTILSDNLRETNESETLLTIKPRLLSLPPTETASREIWIGTESRLRPPM